MMPDPYWYRPATVSLNVGNPHVREILEEAYEEWKLCGPR